MPKQTGLPGHKRATFAFLSLSLLSLGAIASTNLPRVSSVVTVTQSNLGNWFFAEEPACRGTDPYDASTQFVLGPATPPLGSGSLNMQVGVEGDSSPRYFLKGYSGTPLSSLTSLSYSTYVQQNQGSQAIYLRLYVDTTGTGTTPDDAIFFEPAYQTHASGNASLPDQGALTTGSWQTWDALAGGWWSNNSLCNATAGTGVKSIADYLVCFPNARIMDVDANRGGVSLQAGCGGATDWGNFNGDVDALTVGTSTSSTTFDFELGVTDVSGTKTAAGQFVPGGAVTYTVVLTNSGSVAQGNNPGDEFVDNLPASLTLTGASATAGTTTTAANTVHWNGSIPAGGSVTITIHATINPDAGNSTISNVGTIFFDANGDGTNESTSTTAPATIFFVVATPVPAASSLALALSALLLALCGAAMMRR